MLEKCNRRGSSMLVHSRNSINIILTLALPTRRLKKMPYSSQHPSSKLLCKDLVAKTRRAFRVKRNTCTFSTQFVSTSLATSTRWASLISLNFWAIMILYRVQKSKHCTRILRTKSWSYSPVLKKLTKKRNNARLSYSDRLRSSAKWKDRRRSRRCLMTRKRRLKRPRHKKLKKRLLKPLLRLQQKLKRLLKRKRPMRK